MLRARGEGAAAMTGEGDVRCEYERPNYQLPSVNVVASQSSGECRRRARPRDAGDTHLSPNSLYPQLTHSTSRMIRVRPTRFGSQLT